MCVPFDLDGSRGPLQFRAMLTFDRSFEHLGDSVLGLVVTDLLRDTFPYLRVGPTTVFDAPHRPATLTDIPDTENSIADRRECQSGVHVRPFPILF